MNKRTKPGRLITSAEIWLTWMGQDPDRYPVVSTIRRDQSSIPLNRSDARKLWGRRCFGVEFTDDASDFMHHLLGAAS